MFDSAVTLVAARARLRFFLSKWPPNASAVGGTTSGSGFSPSLSPKYLTSFVKYL
jgi:hypothetical protein